MEERSSSRSVAAAQQPLGGSLAVGYSPGHSLEKPQRSMPTVTRIFIPSSSSNPFAFKRLCQPTTNITRHVCCDAAAAAAVAVDDVEFNSCFFCH
jgi:hypothetical protein